MTRFNSPALDQPELRLSAGAIRAALGTLAFAFTSAVWLIAGASAGQFGQRDRDLTRITLEPVLVTAAAASLGRDRVPS